MTDAVIDRVAPDEVELELSDQDLEPLDPAWNLQERHAAIMRALAKLGVDVTGRNRFKRPALSIEDVDVLLERLMGWYGVVSDYEFATDEEGRALVTCVRLDKSDDEGVYERWEVTVISVIRDSRPQQEREVERRMLFDVGSNPSAAVSFALKRHKRELYHLGAVKEGVSDESVSRERRGMSRRDLKGVACPLCGVTGALGWSSRKSMYYCATGEGGCGEEFPDLAAAKPAMGPARQDAFNNLVALGADVGMGPDGRRRGASFWPEVKVKARVKLLASTTNTFERLTDEEWERGVEATRAELVKEHRQWCGAGCQHLRGWAE